MDQKPRDEGYYPVRAADYMSVATHFCIYAAKYGLTLSYVGDGQMAAHDENDIMGALPGWDMTGASTNIIFKAAYRLAFRMAGWDQLYGSGRYKLVSWAEPDCGYKQLPRWLWRWGGMKTEKVVQWINNWDKENVSRLRECLEYLEGEIWAEMEEENPGRLPYSSVFGSVGVDIHNLPTCPIPDYVWYGAPVWAVDKAGRVLMGHSRSMFNRHLHIYNKRELKEGVCIQISGVQKEQEDE